MLRIRDVMTRDVLTVTPETSLREAAELFARRHVSGAPVVAGDKVVGVVSVTDLLDFLVSRPGVPIQRDAPMDGDEWAASPGPEDGDTPSATYFTDLWSEAGADSAERFDSAQGPEWDVLAEHTVGEVMTPSVRSLAADLPVATAAGYMRQAGVHRVVVLEHGRLVGIITTSDVTRAVAEHLLTARSHRTSLGARRRAHEAADEGGRQ